MTLMIRRKKIPKQSLTFHKWFCDASENKWWILEVSGMYILKRKSMNFIRYLKKVGSVPEVPSKCRTHETAHLILLLANYMSTWGIMI